MAGIDRIPPGIQQNILSSIQRQVQSNPQLAAVLNSAISLLRSLNTDSFSPANGNTGIVPPGVATGNGNTGIVPPAGNTGIVPPGTVTTGNGNTGIVPPAGNTGIVPPGVTGTNGNTGIVPPAGNTGIVPPGTVTTGNGNTGIVPPDLARPTLPPPPLGTGSGNVGNILARLGQILQILGQLIQSLGGQNGGGKPSPITSSPPWEKEFLAWASPFTKDAYSQLKQNGIQLSEQEAVKLGEMSPEQQKSYVSQRIAGGGAQPAPAGGNDFIQQMMQKYLPMLSPEQQAMFKLGQGANSAVENAAWGGQPLPPVTAGGAQAPQGTQTQPTTQTQPAPSTQQANSAQRRPDSRLQMLQAVVQALSALVSLVSRMTEMNRSRSIAG